MKKQIIKVFLMALILFAVPNSIKAATFSVTKSADNIKPSGEFIVIVKASNFESDESITGYTLYIDYDVTKIEFVSDEGSPLSNISSNGGRITITNKDGTEQKSDFELAKIKMRAKNNASAGSSNLSLSGSCGNSCNGANVTVAALGTDATLSSLSIPNTTLNPEFSSGTTSYRTSIQDITSLTVNATPTDSSAKVQISDNYKNLQKGDNKIDVVVTSEDGNNQKTYTINVTLNMTPTEEELLKANATLKELKVKDQKLDFDPNEKKYYLTVDNKIEKLEVTAKATNDKAKVTVENNSKLKVGKNTIKITVVSEDTTKTETYQIIVTRNEAEKEVKKTCPDINNMSNWTNMIWIVISITAFVTFTLGIVLGYFLCKKDVLHKIFKKKNRKKKNDEEAVPIETLSDTIDLSDTINEINKR